MDTLVQNSMVTSGWEAIDIYLFSNGEEQSPPRKYHLKIEELESWEDTLNALAQSQYGENLSKINLYTLDGNKIANPLQLSNGASYVAVQPHDEFIPAGYQNYIMKASRSWEKRKKRKDSQEFFEISTDDSPINTNVEKKYKHSVNINIQNLYNPGPENIDLASSKDTIQESSELSEAYEPLLGDHFIHDNDNNIIAKDIRWQDNIGIYHVTKVKRPNFQKENKARSNASHIPATKLNKSTKITPKSSPKLSRKKLNDKIRPLSISRKKISPATGNIPATLRRKVGSPINRKPIKSASQRDKHVQKKPFTETDHGFSRPNAPEKKDTKKTVPETKHFKNKYNNLTTPDRNDVHKVYPESKNSAKLKPDQNVNNIINIKPIADISFPDKHPKKTITTNKSDISKIHPISKNSAKSKPDQDEINAINIVPIADNSFPDKYGKKTIATDHSDVNKIHRESNSAKSKPDQDEINHINIIPIADSSFPDIDDKKTIATDNSDVNKVHRESKSSTKLKPNQDEISHIIPIVDNSLPDKYAKQTIATDNSDFNYKHRESKVSAKLKPEQDEIATDNNSDFNKIHRESKVSAKSKPEQDENNHINIIPIADNSFPDKYAKKTIATDNSDVNKIHRESKVSAKSKPEQDENNRINIIPDNRFPGKYAKQPTRTYDDITFDDYDTRNKIEASSDHNHNVRPETNDQTNQTETKEIVNDIVHPNSQKSLIPLSNNYPDNIEPRIRKQSISSAVETNEKTLTFSDNRQTHQKDQVFESSTMKTEEKHINETIPLESKNVNASKYETESNTPTSTSQNQRELTTVVREGEVFNLKLNIHNKNIEGYISVDKGNNRNNLPPKELILIDKASQTNLNIVFKDRSSSDYSIQQDPKTAIELLTDREETPNIVVVQCICCEEFNVDDLKRVIPNAFLTSDGEPNKKFIILLPNNEILEWQNENQTQKSYYQTDNYYCDKCECQITETNGQSQMDLTNVYKETNNVPKTSKDLKDAQTETDWNNTLLIPKEQVDGHYAFRLPPLEDVKMYN